MSTATALKWAARLFGVIAFASYVAFMGFAIFGPAHDNFWHTVTPGNVVLRMGRRSSGISYVKPWVATWYYRSAWIGLASAVLAGCAGVLSTRLAAKPDAPNVS